MRLRFAGKLFPERPSGASNSMLPSRLELSGRRLLDGFTVQRDCAFLHRDGIARQADKPEDVVLTVLRSHDQQVTPLHVRRRDTVASNGHPRIERRRHGFGNDTEAARLQRILEALDIVASCQKRDGEGDSGEAKGKRHGRTMPIGRRL